MIVCICSCIRVHIIYMWCPLPPVGQINLSNPLRQLYWSWLRYKVYLSPFVDGFLQLVLYTASYWQSTRIKNIKWRIPRRNNSLCFKIYTVLRVIWAQTPWSCSSWFENEIVTTWWVGSTHMAHTGQREDSHPRHDNWEGRCHHAIQNDSPGINGGKHSHTRRAACVVHSVGPIM